MATRIPARKRIERTRYGDPQHEVATGDERVRYGDPQHDPHPPDPQVAERLYDDRSWIDGIESDGGRPALDSSSRLRETLA